MYAVVVVVPFFFFNSYLLPSLFLSPSSPFFMGKPSTSLPSFSNFAKISLPFFQCALCSLIESSKGLVRQEDELPTMAEVVTQAHERALP